MHTALQISRRDGNTPRCHRLPMPLSLPTEVLTAIICQCTSSANIVQVSRRFAAIAYSISYLWSFVCLRPRQLTHDGLHHLANRLARVSNTPLDIIIGPITLDHETIVTQLCAVITNIINSRSIAVRQLAIDTELSSLAELVFRSIPINPISCLRSLSISIHPPTILDDDEPELLNNCLVDALESNELLLLAELSLTGCLPLEVQEDNMPILISLCTLFFDETTIEVPHHPGLEALILASSPNLQIVSIRQAALYDTEPFNDLGLPNICLRQLAKLELTIGLACQLLPVLEAAGLQELTLDGAFSDNDEDFNNIIDVLQEVSFHSLSHLTLTSHKLDEQAWEWLFFQGPPFPNLEHISLIGIDKPCGFNSALLHRHAQEPVLPLRHLTLLQSHLKLDGNALIHAFTAAAQGQATCIVEYDDCLGLESETEVELKNLGVHLQLEGNAS